MHCGPDIVTAGLSVIITPGPQAINQLKHPIVRDLAVYTHSALGHYPSSGLVRVYQPDPSLAWPDVLQSMERLALRD